MTIWLERLWPWAGGRQERSGEGEGPHLGLRGVGGPLAGSREVGGRPAGAGSTRELSEASPPSARAEDPGV